MTVPRPHVAVKACRLRMNTQGLDVRLQMHTRAGSDAEVARLLGGPPPGRPWWRPTYISFLNLSRPSPSSAIQPQACTQAMCQTESEENECA